MHVFGSKGGQEVLYGPGRVAFGLKVGNYSGVYVNQLRNVGLHEDGDDASDEPFILFDDSVSPKNMAEWKPVAQEYVSSYCLLPGGKQSMA